MIELSQKQKMHAAGYASPEMNRVSGVGGIAIGGASRDASSLSWTDWKKRPVVIQAVRMEQDFQVHTLEGLMSGKAGDYLIQGVNGELHPCDAEIFHKTYDRITG